MNFLNRILSFLSSFIKRSFKTHGTISVADLERSNAFYQQLGFRRVMSSRGDEVVLLRNHLGDELNLVKRAGERVTVAFESESLVDLQALTALNPQVSQDGLGPRVGFTDPDGNNVEFYQVNSNLNRPVKSVFHIATREEVLAGLSEHYYMPPTAARRFVYANEDSSFVEIALAQLDGDGGLIVEMDKTRLSFRSVFDDDVDRIGTYPEVNSPIPREALLFASESAGPRKFRPLDEFL